MKIKKILIVLASFYLFSSLINIPLLADAGEEKTYHASDISALLHRLEKKVTGFETLKTDFVQEKNLAIFQKKIVLKGRIYLQRPHKVVWRVDEPVKYSVLITDEFVRQWDEDTNEVQEIPLSRSPVFRAVLDQLTAWFSGRYVSLLEDYDVQVQQQSPFVLRFVPRETSITKKIIKHITVAFRKDEKYLKQIKFQEIGGDSTTIIFKNTILNAPIDDSVFRISSLREQGQGLALYSPRNIFYLVQMTELFSNGVDRRV